MTSKPQPAPEARPGLLVVDDDALITDALSFAQIEKWTLAT